MCKNETILDEAAQVIVDGGESTDFPLQMRQHAILNTIAEQAESGPIVIELDGPVPSEPGEYAVATSGGVQFVRVYQSQGCLVARLAEDYVMSTSFQHYRWSRRLQIEVPKRVRYHAT